MIDKQHTKGIVKREVVEVLSPGTAMSDNYLKQNENNYFCAVVLENNICGVAVLDHSTGEFQTCSRKQSELLSLIKQFHVSEIIIPEDQEKLAFMKIIIH